MHVYITRIYYMYTIYMYILQKANSQCVLSVSVYKLEKEHFLKVINISHLSGCIHNVYILYIHVSTYLSTYLSIYLSTYLPTYLPTYLSIYISIYLSIYLSLPACLPAFNVAKNMGKYQTKDQARD